MRFTSYWEECQLDLQIFQTCECEKRAVYEILKTGIVDERAPVFTTYHDQDITLIRLHVYGQGTKFTKKIIDSDENSLHLYCSVDTMPCGKNTLNEKPLEQK